MASRRFVPGALPSEAESGRGSSAERELPLDSDFLHQGHATSVLRCQLVRDAKRDSLIGRTF